MEKPHHRRHQSAAARGGAADSPRLVRSKSGSTAMSYSEKYSISPKIGEIPAKKSRKKPEAGGAATADGGSGGGAAVCGGGFIRFAPRTMSKIEVPRRTRSASTSPSAWALSPGRSQPCSSPAPAAVPKSPASFAKSEAKGGGGVSGVLKYFRQRKVSPLVEEEYHRFRVAYNRLLQWRFANARAEASMNAVKKMAEKKVFNGWVRIYTMRSVIMEKRLIIQKMKHEMKMYHIMSSEMRLLNEWSKIEPKNVEAVGRVVRKLSAISICLPLVQDAEADTMAVYDAMTAAMEVMESIRTMILDIYWQVEQTCYMLTELSVMLKQQKQFFEELEKRVTVVASLEVQEKSLRAHHSQLVKEVKAIAT